VLCICQWWAVIFDVSDVFLVVYLQAAAGLAHIQVAGVAVLLVNSAFVVGWKLVVIGWFYEPCYGVASEGDFYVSVNRLVILRMCREVKVKVVHFVLFSAFARGEACIVLCCI
jgi:hypothetical protein